MADVKNFGNILKKTIGKVFCCKPDDGNPVLPKVLPIHIKIYWLLEFKFVLLSVLVSPIDDHSSKGNRNKINITLHLLILKKLSL